MGYGFGVFAKLEDRFDRAPAARKALPFVSVALLLVGSFVMFASLSGGAQEPEVVPPDPTAGIQKALIAAQTYYAEQSTFEGFDDPRVAEGMEPSLTWNKAAKAVEGEISIRSANPNKALLVTRVEGQVYCAAASADGEVSKGKTDASRSAECVGTW